MSILNQKFIVEIPIEGETIAMEAVVLDKALMAHMQSCGNVAMLSGSSVHVYMIELCDTGEIMCVNPYQIRKRII